MEVKEINEGDQVSILYLRKVNDKVTRQRTKRMMKDMR